ncbi:MAG: hemerythrin domain-containing protein [Acidobacteria bacterium]|nr:hemerythrin domain-containing protein [Acidobacteriota bacterium]
MTRISKVHECLEDDHAELDVLVANTFDAIEAADARKAFEDLDYFWARLGMHIRAEHLRLFPAVRKAAAGSAEHDGISKMLEQLREDHDFFMTELARAIKAMRLVFSFGNEAETLTIVRGLLEGVVERLKVHNQIEEEQIYTLTGEAFLDAGAAEELLASVRMELARYPNRFLDRAPA